MVRALLILVLCAKVVYAGTQVSQFAMDNGQILRVIVGEVITREQLGALATTPDPAGFQPVTIDLVIGKKTVPLVGFLQREGENMSVRGFSVLAAAADTDSVILVCATGAVLHVQRIWVTRSSLREQAMLLPFGDWMEGNAIRPLGPGEVSASIRRSHDGSRWIVGITHERRRSIFEQDGSQWKFAKKG